MKLRRAAAGARRGSGALLRLILGVCGLAAALLGPRPAIGATGRTLTVGAGRSFATIVDALAAAADGDTLEVYGGVYPALVVDKRVALRGSDAPVIDGGGRGTVVLLSAPGIVFTGFVVRGSGPEPDRDHSGITITAPDVIVEANRLEDVLFGVYVSEADNALVRGNDITSKAEFDEARKGDGIRVWYSNGVQLVGNTVHDARDIVLWYSKDLVLSDNRVMRGRYGVHFMYCDGAQVERNDFEANSTGLYVMYSHNVILRYNTIRGQWGPSGYGVGFKESDNVTLSGNVIVDNRGGLFFDGTPFTLDGYAHITDNIVAYNDVGVTLLPAVKNLEITGNVFWENTQQMSLAGSGTPGLNHWRGNAWSDYTGYDLDGDGVGDTPYRAEHTFEGIADNEPLLRAFFFSPAAQAIEFAGQALPVLKPQPRLVDEAPVLDPGPLPAYAAPREHGVDGLVGAVVSLAGLALGIVGLTHLTRELSEHPMSAAGTRTATLTVLTVSGVSKTYGRTRALESIGFDVRPGEAIALWGANGAGKSTLIKSILGVIAFEGRIDVCGHDVRTDGKRARARIGYVPQDVALYDETITDTLTYLARLKSAPIPRVATAIADVGLGEHAHKRISTLSGGLRQRVALAAALLGQPTVLLLDEPTANLDAEAQREYLTQVSRLARDRNTAVIFSSHRLEEVQALADRVLLLEQGRLVASLRPKDLLRRLMPNLDLMLWVPEARRVDALACFKSHGFPAHLNGRGSVVVTVPADDKERPFMALAARGIPVLDVEIVQARVHATAPSAGGVV